MLDIILATARPDSLPAFIEVLSSDPEVRLTQVFSGHAALAAAGAGTPHLIIVDSLLPDSAPTGLVRQLIVVNAMINSAVISPLSEAAFHEEMEGLGILARLPMHPEAGDAVNLLAKLRQVLGI